MESVSVQTTQGTGNSSASSPVLNSENNDAPPRGSLNRQSRSPLARLEERLLRRVLKAIGDPPISLVLWDGQEISTADGAANTLIPLYVRDRRALWGLIIDPFYQFPEAYADGRIDTIDDLERLLCLLGNATADSPDGGRWFTGISRLLHWPRRNTLAGSKHNIHCHYDIGNEFYRLWLDQNLLYTCAYFEDPAASLEDAQLAKMDHVCRKLDLQPGETVIEAGCGWGGFALHMAKHYGVRVRAYNISREQIAEARRRAAAEELDDRVEFVLDDWRNIRSKCDVFVSIGMLEHVGTPNYRRLGKVIDRCLSPSGRGLIHSIGRNRPQPFDPWIERRIFPGAYPPSLRQMGKIFEPQSFSILDVENLRLHYAATLRHWLSRYERSIDAVHRMYDAAFVRMWRFYLASSIAAFETASLQLFQVVFTRPGLNHIPLTRAHQYQHLFDPGRRRDAGDVPQPCHWGPP
jgi:cyclopropane-fatty-acyl-phospholipid synthase